MTDQILPPPPAEQAASSKELFSPQAIQLLGDLAGHIDPPIPERKIAPLPTASTGRGTTSAADLKAQMEEKLKAAMDAAAADDKRLEQVIETPPNPYVPDWVDWRARLSDDLSAAHNRIEKLEAALSHLGGIVLDGKHHLVAQFTAWLKSL